MTPKKDEIILHLKRKHILLHDCGERWLNDMDVVQTGLESSPDSYPQLPNKYRSRPEIALKAVEVLIFNVQYIPKSLTNDRAFVLQLVKINGKALFYLEQPYYNDREILLEALRTELSIFKDYASAWMRRDQDFVCQALLINHEVAEYVPDHSLFQDRDFILEYVQAGKYVLDYVPRRWLNDRDVILEAVKHKASIYSIPERFLSDMELIQLAMEYDVDIVGLIPESLRSRELMFKAVEINGYVYRYVPVHLNGDKDLAMLASRTWKDTLCWSSKSLRDDMDLAIISGTLQYISKRLRSHPAMIRRCIMVHSSYREVLLTPELEQQYRAL